MKNERIRRRGLLRRSTVFAVLLCGIGISGSASANLITNGSFETPVVPPGSFILVTPGSSFDGWTVAGAPGNVAPISGLFTSFGLSFTAQDGAQWLDLTGLSNTATGVQQTVVTDVGTIYDLSFWVGNQVNPTGIYGISSSIEVFAGGVALGTATNTGGTGTTTQNWEQFFLSFTATSPLTTIEFLNRDASNDNTNGLDNIVLLAQGSPQPTIIPEPGSLSLFAVSLIALKVVRRRKAH